MRSQNPAVRALGLIAFVIAAVGYVFFDWRFSDGTENPVAFAIAILAVVVAVGVTLRDRL